MVYCCHVVVRACHPREARVSDACSSAGVCEREKGRDRERAVARACMRSCHHVVMSSCSHVAVVPCDRQIKIPYCQMITIRCARFAKASCGHVNCTVILLTREHGIAWPRRHASVLSCNRVIMMPSHHVAKTRRESVYHCGYII